MALSFGGYFGFVALDVGDELLAHRHVVFRQNMSHTAFHGSDFDSSSSARRSKPCPSASYARSLASGSSNACIMHFCVAREPIT